MFVSSTLEELAAERQAVRDAVTRLRLVPVMFELGARPHPPREVYRAYLAQSQVFIGIYWQRYGWVAPGEQISGLEDEYLLSAGRPRLLYVKTPAPDREPGLDAACSTPDRFTILISLYDLALASQARGDLDGARGLLRQGLSLAAEAGDESAAAYYLEALAAIARQQDDPQRAAWLLAAAGAQLQASGSGWLHAYVPRAPHDHSVEAELRSRMGDAAYEQAAAHGRSLTGARGIQQGLAEVQRDPQRQDNPALGKGRAVS